MIKEFLESKKKSNSGEGQGKMSKGKDFEVIDIPELSLSPFSSVVSKINNSSSLECDGNNKKRKQIWDEPMSQTLFELQLNDPLPLDWEQCLDLQSGRMYYLNRKNMRKTWIRPREQQLDLDLNISTFSRSKGQTTSTLEEANMQYSSNGHMVAVPCTNCHLLVMLCESSPACPNCRYMHSLQQSAQEASPHKIAKSMDTLNFFHINSRPKNV